MGTTDLTQAEILRYSRHLLIPEVGLAGQRKLKAASVLIVGTGGLGSPISLYLAAAGVGRIGLVDFDVVDSSNLQRQIAHGTDRIGMAKVESARLRMVDLNPFIQVDTYNEPFTVENAERISAGYQILIDGTDNFPSRYLLNDLAVMTAKPFVYGSIFRFEGQVSVFDARRGPCYRCLFPEAPPPGVTMTCGEGGVFGVLPGTIGTLQASEVIKLILEIGTPLIGKLLLYDALESSFLTIQVRKNPACKLCGEHPSILHLSEDTEACSPFRLGEDLPPHPAEMSITPAELASRTKNGDSFTVLDVRENVEQQVSSFPGAVVCSHMDLHNCIDSLDKDREIIVLCRTGLRAARAAEQLRKAGFLHVRVLAGGINAWARDVDPRMLQY